MTPSWDVIRKEARRLETDIDAKLVEYSKLAASLQSSSRPSFEAARPSTEDEAVQRRALPRDRALADAMTLEMESLLSRLRGVVDAMSDTSLTSTVGPTLQHTRQRHSEILHDYNQEFRKTRDAIASSRDTADLMAGVNVDVSAANATTMGSHVGVDALYKERASIAAATGGAETAIATGLSLKEDLDRQRAMFASMVERMETMSEGLPAVNRLIGQIRRKKKRDVFVVAGVVGILLFMTFSWKVLH